MGQRQDFSQREVDHWLASIPKPSFDVPALVAATRLWRLASIQAKLDSLTLRDFDSEGVAGAEDFRTLALLQRSDPDGMTNGDLVGWLGGSKSGMSNRLDRFIAGGLVERIAIPHDRRTHANALTPRGREVTNELLVAIARKREQIFAGLPASQLMQLSETLGEVLQAVDPDG